MSADTFKGRMRQVQFLAVAFVALLLAPPLGLVVAGVLVAVFIARRQFRATGVLLSLAMLAGWLSPIQHTALTNPLMVAALGMPIGFGLLSGRGYWRVVALSTVLIFVVNGGALMGLSEEVAAASAEAGQGIDGADGAQFTDFQLALYEMQEWILDHWSSVIFGFAFSGAVFSACIVTSLTAWWLRRSGVEILLGGGFRRMRLPDGLVWCVILVAAFWFADEEWSIGWMRIISWNGAFALATMYWLNGLSIVAYAMAAFKPNPFMIAAMLLMAVLIRAIGLLSILGLFDTWGEFRRRIDEALTARQLKEDSRDDSI